MKVGIVSQARMSSSRLPGKVLKLVKGEALLWHHIQRLKEVNVPLFVATSKEKDDDAIVDFCRLQSVSCFRGSRDDVLSRYFHGAQEHNLDVIIRVTSDCPLIDSALICRGLDKYLRLNSSDVYLSNCLERTFPRGMDFEIFSFKLLQQAFENATLAEHREHVTPYIRENSLGKTILVNDANDEDYSQYRLTVDEQADFDLLRLLIEEYHCDKKGYKEIVQLLKSQPQLAEINACVKQKEVYKVATIEQKMEYYFDRLWPICRSLSGEGVRQSLGILKELLPLDIHEIPSHSQVFDWIVPQEWNIEDAYLLDPTGKKILDFKNNNLHVLGYSEPVDLTLTLSELDKHLYSLPSQPEAIPYVTSYYQRRWGFCLSHSQRQSLQPGNYRAVIKSRLHDGSLSFGDCFLKATRETSAEILFSTYICHPSLANNELSGPLVAAFLYNKLAAKASRFYNYRFVFVPETIGAITYLSRWGEHLKKHCLGGFVLTCCGDEGPLTYKKSRRGDSIVDYFSEKVLKQFSQAKGCDLKIYDFFPTGSDERQYCSPGFNLPIGSLMRSMYGEYKEYHTSLDNKNFISFNAMAEMVDIYLTVVEKIEETPIYRSLLPFGEPQLGKRHLYPTLGGKDNGDKVKNMNYLLNFSDGCYALAQIADKAHASLKTMQDLAESLHQAGLITPL